MARPKTITVISLAVAAAALLASLVIAVPAARRKPAPEPETVVVEFRTEHSLAELEDMRSKLLSVAAIYYDLGDLVQDRDIQSLCDQAMDALDQLSHKDLALIAGGKENYDLLVVAAENLSDQVHRNLGNGPQPATQFETLTPGLPGPGYSSLCGGTRPSTGLVYGALLARTAAESAQLGASSACNQTTVVLGSGGNCGLCCLALDVLVAATKGFEDGLTFCSDDIDSVEIATTLERSEHIHSDIEILDGKLDMIIEAIEELRVLSCATIRLLNTPEGLRFEDCETCSDQPLFPYEFPEPDIRRSFGRP